MAAAAAAKSLQSCPTLCDPVDGSPPGSPVPGILQARTLEWGAISFSNAGKWKVKVKSLSCVRPLATPWTTAYQAPPSMGFPGKSTGVGCHRLLHILRQRSPMFLAPGTSFVEDNFPMAQGGVEFQDDSRTCHLLCSLFLLLLHQVHLIIPGIRSRRLGPPELRYSPSLKSAD